MKQTMGDKVKQILTDYPKTREDDNFLYIKFLQLYTDIDVHKDLFTIFVYSKEYNLPSYASIIRARRKIQVDNAELEAPARMKKIREQEEVEYHEFYGQKGLLY